MCHVVDHYLLCFLPRAISRIIVQMQVELAVTGAVAKPFMLASGKSVEDWHERWWS